MQAHRPCCTERNSFVGAVAGAAALGFPGSVGGLLRAPPSHPTAVDNLEGKIGVAPAATQSQNESLLLNLHNDENYSHPEILRETIRKPKENGGLKGLGVQDQTRGLLVWPHVCRRSKRSIREAGCQTRTATGSPSAEAMWCCDLGRRRRADEPRIQKHQIEGCCLGPGGADTT